MDHVGVAIGLAELAHTSIVGQRAGRALVCERLHRRCAIVEYPHVVLWAAIACKAWSRPGLGAQGESERRLWSTVVQKTAIELTERAREISDAVTALHRLSGCPTCWITPRRWKRTGPARRRVSATSPKCCESGADPVKAVKLGSATVEYALDGAQHGVPLTTLMRSYRLGHAATSRHLRAILAKHVADADELTSATDLCSAWLFAYVDAALCLVEDVYVTERERWLRSAAASQAEAISTILAGQPIDTDVASRRLRHDLRRVHVAAIAWLDAHEEGRNTLALLEAAIRDIAAAIGTQRPLIQPARHTLGRCLDQHQ